MSGKNLIVASNPARRRKRRVSAAQRAAARRNIKKAQAARRRRAAPARRRTTTTPRRRRRAAPRRSYRRRSNPILVRGIIDRQLIPAAIGGGGAVLNDVLFNYLPLPAMLKAGMFRHAAKAGLAIVLGIVASKVVKKTTADQIGSGALTVVGYNVVREAVAKFAPNIQMGEYLDPGLGYTGAGYNPLSTGLGEYLDPNALNGLPGVSMGNQFSQGSPYMGEWPDEFDEQDDYELMYS